MVSLSTEAMGLSRIGLGEAPTRAYRPWRRYEIVWPNHPRITACFGWHIR